MTLKKRSNRHFAVHTRLDPRTLAILVEYFSENERGNITAGSICNHFLEIVGKNLQDKQGMKRPSFEEAYEILAKHGVSLNQLTYDGQSANSAKVSISKERMEELRDLKLDSDPVKEETVDPRVLEALKKMGLV